MDFQMFQDISKKISRYCTSVFISRDYLCASNAKMALISKRLTGKPEPAALGSIKNALGCALLWAVGCIGGRPQKAKNPHSNGPIQEQSHREGNGSFLTISKRKSTEMDDLDTGMHFVTGLTWSTKANNAFPICKVSLCVISIHCKVKAT